jgi:hemerythrin-like domain-containing protein
MAEERRVTRRELLSRAPVAAGVGGVLLMQVSTAAEVSGPAKPADVNATEDLMREHGVLRRVLLVYGEGIRRIHGGTPPPAEVLASAGGIVRHFIEGYHEKLEEEQVFPRLVKAGKQQELVKVLLAQHAVGRKLTAQILEGATAAGLKDKAHASALAGFMEQFIRMYEPHASREDTVLFPAFHDLFTEKEFDALGDKFEEEEHRVLGSAGFEGTVEQVAQLERALGIHDLAQFTAHG